MNDLATSELTGAGCHCPLDITAMKSLRFVKGLSFVGNESPKNVSIYLAARYTHYDVAISGGGLVGTAMACSIAKNPILSDKSVAVFESFPKRDTPKKSVNDPYSNRVISLNPGTRKFFESLGVWKYISDVRYKTVKKMQVWDACSDAMIVFNEDLENDVSYIVENDVVLYSIQQVLKEQKENRVTIQYGTNINSVTLPSIKKTVTIGTNKGDSFTCNLLIGADGAKSQIRQILGKQHLHWEYNQMGIVATLKLSEPSDNIVAWQRFLPSGPIALLPLTDQLSSLVWSTTTEEAKELLKRTDESFIDAVNDAFWKSYPKDGIVEKASDFTTKALEMLMLSSGAVRQLPPSVKAVLPESRAAFPLGFGHATAYVAPKVALIGDAAHRVHPLAGQGVNLGFGDVKCLTQVLSEAVYSGAHIGSFSILRKYQSERQQYNFPTIMAIDCLQKIYGTTFTPVVALRSVGLQITNALHPIKKAIMKYASE